MNAQREKFCIAYAACGNATQAAIEAGYSPKTARKQGSRLLTYADIKERIQELTREINAGKIASVSAIQTFWTEVLHDPGAKMVDRLKASELLARSRGAFLVPLDRWDDEGEDGGDVIIYIPDNGRGAAHDE